MIPILRYGIRVTQVIAAHENVVHVWKFNANAVVWEVALVFKASTRDLETKKPNSRRNNKE